MNRAKWSQNIVVDLDDVMIPTMKKVLWFYNHLIGWKELPYDSVTHFHLNKILWFSHLTDQQCKDLFDDLLGDKVFHSSLGFLQDSLEVCRYLKNQWKDLHIGTARSESLKNNTIDLFEQHGAEWLFSSYNFLWHKRDGSDISKLSLCQRLKATIMIEDAPHNAEPVANNGITVFMPYTSWNKEFLKINNNNPHIVGVEGWGEIKWIYQAIH